MIRLYNTKTRQKEDFVPLDPQNVRMYVCGPTVYDRAHLGNARPVLVFDLLYRLLRHAYGDAQVTYVRNFTDVDDRINETAQKRKAAGAEGTLEQLIHARSNETIRWYHEDMDALGALRPTHAPRATDYIPQMVTMIADLIAKGHAYEAEGHVLFAVDSWKDGYGRLSGRSVEDMIAGARVEVAPYKKNPMDFVLWKPSDADLPGWDSPWGRGRPGWHIECSAMAHALLGDTFDIHGGGIDLQFPHHENEIAQSCCAHPQGGFARVWMHNEMLQVEGKKMSKSLGNFFTVHDLLEQGVPGEVIRFVMLSTHYRKPMDWTEKKRREAWQALSNLYEDYEDALHNHHSEIIGEHIEEWRYENLPPPDLGIVQALNDDLNTNEAIRLFKDLASSGDRKDRKHAKQVIANGRFLGFFNTATLFPAIIATRVDDADLQVLELRLSALRAEAMASKNFAKVDGLKSALLEAGVEVRMTKHEVRLLATDRFDPTKLEALK
ncbi:MAG: cysteine--tRNA ligase [Pseudomonadota bacterium]